MSLTHQLQVTGGRVPGRQRYGPQGAEIEGILGKIKDPRNQDVIEPLRLHGLLTNDVAVRAYWNSGSRKSKEGQNTADGAARRAGRENSFWEAYAAGVHYAGAYAWFGMAAVSARDLIGSEFTQGQYEMLTESLNGFLAVVDETEPDSAVRQVACALFADGLGGMEAVGAAKGALVL